MVDISGAYGRLKTWVTSKIAAHTAIPAAHHTPYTDAEAISAVLADDKYLKRDGDILDGDLGVSAAGRITVPSGQIGLTFPQDDGSQACRFKNSQAGRADMGFTGDGGGNMEFYSKLHPTRPGDFRFVYGGGAYGNLIYKHYNGTNWQDVIAIDARTVVKIHVTLDMKSQVIKDIKNHAASALSGTKKLVELNIGGTPYYFEVYPTKA